jgi:Tfp pilus assembly protein PilX
MNLRRDTISAGRKHDRKAMKNQRGIALLTVMLMLLILTILGIASITVTSMEHRMAGFFRSTEAVVAAADSCEGLAVNIIQQARTPPGVIPASFVAPTGPIPTSNVATLLSEIMGSTLPPPAPADTQAENFSDSATTAPNFVITNLPGFTVSGDIDLLYSHNQVGTPGSQHVYRITCVASNPATGSNSTVTSVYGCFDGETCIKKPN